MSPLSRLGLLHSSEPLVVSDPLELSRGKEEMGETLVETDFLQIAFLRLQTLKTF